jgi:hypothetical protein
LNEQAETLADLDLLVDVVRELGTSAARSG